MVVPSVVSLTEMPTNRPRANSDFISGCLHSGRGCAEIGVDVKRLRIERQAREQQVVHLTDGPGEAVAEDPPDLEILEIEPAARMGCVQFGHFLTPRPAS